MITYNFIIIEGKVIIDYLNFVNKEEFFEELWRWTYVDDLWDFIEESDPTEEELNSYINDVFVEENIFHNYEEGTVDCFAFTVNNEGIVHIYYLNEDLINFIYNKIKEHYD